MKQPTSRNIEMQADPERPSRDVPARPSKGQKQEQEDRVGPRPPPSPETLAEGLDGDSGLARTGSAQHGTPKQDTPGRPKSGSSRQQTHAEQPAQTGSTTLDAGTSRRPRP